MMRAELRLPGFARSFVHLLRCAAPCRRSCCPGARDGRSGRRMSGATLVEFVIVLPWLALVLLGMAQLALLLLVRSQLNLATWQAARHASMHNATPAALRHGLLAGLAGMQPAQAPPGLTDLYQRVTLARMQLDHPLPLVRIERLMPIPACFRDWGSPLPNQLLHLRDRRRGPLSGLSVQECNVLKVRVVYAYRPVMPVVRQVWLATMRQLVPHEPLYRAGRIPVETVAVVHMHSDAIAHPQRPYLSRM